MMSMTRDTRVEWFHGNMRPFLALGKARLLSNALSGNSRTSMIGTLSPAASPSALVQLVVEREGREKKQPLAALEVLTCFNYICMIYIYIYLYIYIYVNI